MSAFVVSQNHIRVMITAAIRGSLHTSPFVWYGDPITDHGEPYRAGSLDYTNADEIGTMLWLENLRSVDARYRESSPDAIPEAEPYRHEDIVAPPIVVLKAIDCYEYQSCEHDGWRKSSARWFCNALRRQIIANMPGYDAAPWGIAD